MFISTLFTLKDEGCDGIPDQTWIASQSRSRPNYHILQKSSLINQSINHQTLNLRIITEDYAGVIFYSPHYNVLKLSINSGILSIKSGNRPSNIRFMEALNSLKFAA